MIKELKIFEGMEGILLIKGERNWAMFLQRCGFEMLGDIPTTYTIGKIQVMYCENPHYIKDVIGLQ